jgi:hypothetical protein
MILVGSVNHFHILRLSLFLFQGYVAQTKKKIAADDVRFIVSRLRAIERVTFLGRKYNVSISSIIFSHFFTCWRRGAF